jgi:hypothetical protein
MPDLSLLGFEEEMGRYPLHADDPASDEEEEEDV